MPKTVICIVKNQTQAHTVINRLQHAGIASDNISLVMSDHSGRYGQKPNSEDLLGLLSRTGKIVMPRAGFFVAAGPILVAIQDTPESTLKGVSGALISFGLPEFEANRLHDMVRSGAILIAFHTPDNDEAQRIREILDNANVEEISIAGDEDLSDTRHYLRSLSS